MCGIVGYIGPRKNIVQDVILPGLSALEERGYDSAGIASLVGDRLIISKAVGKLDVLRADETLNGMDEATLAIGHTRWATHGGVTVPNAHPHTDCSGDLAIVHNGIIENYHELKKNLEAAGHIFKSETDTEVIAHLIEENLKLENTSLESAVRETVGKLHGTWGLVVMHKKFPNELVLARHGSPILIGLGQDEIFVASLEDAFTSFTKRFFVLPENKVCTVRAEGCSEIAETILTADNDEVVTADPFPHFMLKEIYEQPETILRTINNGGRLFLEDGTAKLGGLEERKTELLSAKHLRAIACGTAKYSAELGSWWLIKYGGFETVQTEAASEARPNFYPSNTAVLAVSQSGETHDTLQKIKEARELGHNVFSIINRVGKAIARETGCGVYTNAGPEKAVASTKVFLAQSVVFLLLTLWFGRGREKINKDFGRALGRALLALSEDVRRTINKTNEQTKKIAEFLAQKPNAYFIGRNAGAMIAKEGALKLKEVVYIHAEAYEAGELKHGAIALIEENFPIIGVILSEEEKDAMINNLTEVKARGAKTIVVAPEGLTIPASAADEVIYFPEAHSMTAPLLAVIPLQLLAYHTAVARGFNPDRPRNLAKSVTVG
jgi:glucosamine--fructose-6-phosphate aminotransferase (isomerizing)